MGKKRPVSVEQPGPEFELGTLVTKTWNTPCVPGDDPADEFTAEGVVLKRLPDDVAGERWLCWYDSDRIGLDVGFRPTRKKKDAPAPIEQPTKRLISFSDLGFSEEEIAEIKANADMIGSTLTGPGQDGDIHHRVRCRIALEAARLAVHDAKAKARDRDETVKCAREACDHAAHPSAWNRITSWLYCLPCARAIEASRPPNMDPFYPYIARPNAVPPVPGSNGVRVTIRAIE